MKTVLMVAEKPSLSQSIAKILSNGNMTSKKGVSSSCMVHEYTGTFRGEQARFKMTAVCGHVMSLDFSGHFNNWDAVEPVELFSALAKKKEANPNLHMVYHLQVAARGCDYVVLWLDCDKEGENICFEVIDAVQKEVRSSKGKVFYRAHFSAITDSEIKKAMSNLGEPNENESLSVDARQELDLRVGCAFTRFQTKFFQGKYGDLDSSLISYGPCQTPTLAFCVARHDIIQSFKPEPFWKLHVVLKPNVTLEWQRGRIFDKEVGNLFCNLVKGQSVATVIKVQEKEKRKQPPIALNTVELLRVASSGLGIGPQQTMQIAERLYIQGYISYPRTETTSYPASFDLIAPLKQQTTGAGWGAYVRQLLSDGIAKPRKGADAGDHPPITPMRSASQHELQGEAWRLYDYIVRHFISTVSKDCVYTLKTMTVNVNNEVFTCEGKTVVEAGFTEVMYHQAISQEESVPNFKEMQKIEIKEAKLLERFTFPPDYLTESELITLMEKHGIGTDASIPIHINNISQRNYVTVENGRKLIPTSLGVVLVHGYHKIDPELALPTIRAAVERQLAKIADGTADYEAVLDYSVEMFEKKFEYFTRNIENMDELFECSFTKLSESGKPMSRCGKCRRFMKYITAKPYRLHCSHCDETYALPQDGYVKLYQELRCPLDDFELLLWTRGGKTKSTPLCPCCYTQPPLENMPAKSECNRCPHPTCKHSMANLTVMECDACADGRLVIEPFTAPNWLMSCNRCSSVWSLLKGLPKVKVNDEVCQCGASLLEVHFDKDKSPLEDGKTVHSGCPRCDSVLASRVRCLTTAEASSKRGGGGKGRSRGRSRGDKGRGGARGGGRGGGGGGGEPREGGRGRGGGGGGGRKGGRGGDDGEYTRPRASHNLAEFINF